MKKLSITISIILLIMAQSIMNAASPQWESLGKVYPSWAFETYCSAKGLLYIGGMGPVMYSIDNGATWVEVFEEQSANMHTIFEYKEDPAGKMYVGCVTGLYVSENGRSDWVNIFDKDGVDNMYFDNSGHKFLITKGNLSISKLYVCDESNDWQYITPPGFNLKTYCFYADDGLLLLSNGNDLMISTNLGATWTKAGDANTHQMFTSITKLNEKYLATSKSGSTFLGIFESENGADWTKIELTPADASFEWIEKSTCSDKLYGVNYDKGCFISTDKGRTWEAFNSGLTNMYIYDLGFAQDGNVFNVNQDGLIYKAGFGTSGVENSADNSSVLVYPNPATDEKLTIKFDGSIAPEKIEIFNLKGELKYSSICNPASGNTYEIPVENLVSGAYLLRYKTGNIMKIIRFTKV